MTKFMADAPERYKQLIEKYVSDLTLDGSAIDTDVLMATCDLAVACLRRVYPEDALLFLASSTFKKRFDYQIGKELKDSKQIRWDG